MHGLTNRNLSSKTMKHCLSPYPSSFLMPLCVFYIYMVLTCVSLSQFVYILSLSISFIIIVIFPLSISLSLHLFLSKFFCFNYLSLYPCLSLFPCLIFLSPEVSNAFSLCLNLFLMIMQKGERCNFLTC